MAKVWKLGVVGAARRGRIARIAHQPENGIILAAAADNYEPSIDEFKDWAKEKNHSDYYVTHDVEKLLKDPNLDGVFITAPDYLHEEFAVKALETGKSVYLEKPMAITIEGCDRILATAKKNNAKLFVGHNMRYMDFVLKMKEVLDSGLIGTLQSVWCRHFINYGGEAYFKDWHSEQKYVTSLLLQKGAHDIDVIHWLSGSYSKKVSAMGKLSVYNRCARRGVDERQSVVWNDSNWPPLEQKGFSPVINVEDHNMVLMELQNGVQACYLQSHYAPDSSRNYTFIGDKGRLENLDTKNGSRVIVKTNRNYDFQADPDIVYNFTSSAGGHGGSDPRIVNGFLDYMIHDKEPYTNPIAARNAVAVGVKAAEFLRQDLQMEVPEYRD